MANANNGQLFPLIDEQQKIDAEKQINDRQKDTDFDIREYPVEVIVSKFNNKLDDDRAELFIPDYQRELIWSDHQQSRFIESILLNLPIPYLYVADVNSGEDEGRIEIVDGSQRIRTLVRFLGNDLKLEKLEMLNKLNGFYFKDLTVPRQLRFNRKTLRMIELIQVDEEARRQLFDRLNSGGSILNEMEKRAGSRDGLFITYTNNLATNERFRRLCPISEIRIKHQDYREMILRFFAYRDNYLDFNKEVYRFINDYVDDKNNNGFDENNLTKKFNEMLDFVEKYFPDHFRKSPTNKTVSRIRFEAISVGTSLALEIKPDLVPANMSWLHNEEFKQLIRSDASNSRPKVINRIHYVRDSLLGREIEYAN